MKSRSPRILFAGVARAVSEESVVRRVAKAVYYQELAACRALRYSPVECYNRAAAVLDETFAIAYGPMPVEIVPLPPIPKTKSSIWGPDGWIDEMRRS